MFMLPNVTVKALSATVAATHSQTTEAANNVTSTMQSHTSSTPNNNNSTEYMQFLEFEKNCRSSINKANLPDTAAQRQSAKDDRLVDMVQGITFGRV
jgi:hypothetical protein